MDLTRVEIVLVRPRRAANVAAACRAMKNMGLRTLWLVEPGAGLDEPEARSLAYGAWDVLDGARRASSLLEAVSGSVAVVGTTGRDVPGARTARRLAAEARELAGEEARSASSSGRKRAASPGPRWTCATRSCTCPRTPATRP